MHDPGLVESVGDPATVPPRVRVALAEVTISIISMTLLGLYQPYQLLLDCAMC
jgi:hypothetical protein